MTAADHDTPTLRDAGYLPTPASLDPENPVLLSPDGRRLLTVEQALAEIEEQAS